MRRANPGKYPPFLRAGPQSQAWGLPLHKAPLDPLGSPLLNGAAEQSLFARRRYLLVTGQAGGIAVDGVAQRRAQRLRASDTARLAGVRGDANRRGQMTCEACYADEVTE
jgi:hypothetical protein